MKLANLSLASVLLATSAIAQTLPEMDELSGRLGAELPPYWSVDEFRLIAQSDLGDAARPRTVLRFEANASPTAPLFLQVDSQDPFAIVAASHDEGFQRTLYGVMDLSFRAGDWTGEIDIENPVLDLGQPADLFDRPILVLGDPGAEARVSELREHRESNAVARFERQISTLQNEHESAISQLQQDHQAEMENVRRDHTNALSSLIESQETELAQARTQHAAAIRNLTEAHEVEIAELRAAHELAVMELNREQQAIEGGREAEVEALRQELAEQLTAAETEHATAMRNLARDQRNELQSAVAEHQAAMQAQERELRTELLALTEGLEPDVEAARQEHARIFAEIERTQQAELEELRVNYARERGQLRERLREDFAAAELELSSEVDRLRGQLGRSEEAQSLQAAFLQSVQARNATALELQRELETALARRVSIIQQLPQEYRGGVRCRSNDGRVDRSWQLALQFREINPSGMSGRFNFDGGNTTSARVNGTANLVIRNDEFSLPLQARLSLAGASDANHLPNTIDLTINENVVMRGTETTSWNIDNASVEVSCVYEFS